VLAKLAPAVSVSPEKQNQRGNVSRTRIGGLVAVIVVGLIILGRGSSLLVDWAWFSSIGYVSVFWTVFLTKAVLFFAVWALSALLLWLNGAVALRFAQRQRLWFPLPVEPGVATIRALPGPRAGMFGYGAPALPWRLLSLAVALVVGLFIALGEMGQWDEVLRFLYQMPYGQTDPLFGKDIGFYLFSLPIYVAIRNWLLLVLTLSAIMAGAIYLVHGDINPDRFPWRLTQAVIAHGSALLGVYFAIKAWSYALDRNLLLYNDNGVVVGANYTDVHIMLPILWLLIGLAAFGALVAWINIQRRTWRLPIAAAVLVLGGAFIFAELVPGIYQRFYVKPSELQLEAPFIQRNIALTREAYNLQQIKVQPFPAEQGLTSQSLKNNRGTVNNIRLWDWQPLMDTYAQLQEIRTYYKFLDVDIDRYHLGDSYQQVMLAARELAPSLLSSNAQTWVNLHLLFTHGNGVVMSPVTQKSPEGLPDFYLKDIPPVAEDNGPAVTEPRIYFGQSAANYVIVRTSTPEFDYPRGKDNVYASYDGTDGISIGGIMWRTLFAWHFNDVNILLTDYITGESRIMLHRNIQERVRTIAPFLRLDRDPYVVVSEGRLYWLQDAYTTSAWFPYAQPQPGGENYIRNSVKVAIDAYNGTVTFYVADATDPIIATYQRIFPALFKPLAAMPADLRAHVRYPEDLFNIQALEYRAYHMDAPEVFYNREDLWQFPREPTAPDGIDGGGATRMSPYYVMMRLPGEAHAEFFLMLPMAPSQRENMIAWLAARCDQTDYGKLIVYEFPKDKLVYGPFQIEARINQNTDISQQISLWNQMGSRVIRGNLLVIPIENSILYVSPLYLRAESGQLPELKRVIAAYGDHVVMADTLPEALAALFQGTAPVAPVTSVATAAPVTSAAGAIPVGTADERARAALTHYDRAIERLKAGDWTGFGNELDALRPLLEQLGGGPVTR
jgi:uncharacterized membrane protein (UPF0182 family)